MKLYSFCLTVLLTFSLSGQNLENFFSKTDSFMSDHVKDGKVAYKAIDKDQTSLNELLKIAEEVSVKVADANNYQAFWINAYNLSVIKGIIENYPTKSPLDNKGFFDKTTYNLGGKTITLNDIEHKLLRGNFKDARFHFVLVCGAVGCPPLINKAYLPESLDVQLENQTKLALNGSFLKVNAKKKRVEASEIMKWYKEDFTMNNKSEIDFINEYRIEKLSKDFKLSYFSYNWSLNKQ
ncbi:DUF547 domain-containing protein [Winogradskyella sp. PE311]|uniref:DUF547 domain-containing protein n=1 Tax=Winogradskyella sp. PE311 TaxID=3366943 RepID=UPI00397EA9FE